MTLPTTLTSVGQYSFRQCWYYSKGEKLVIPEGVTTLNNYAFYQCQYLDTELPSTLTTLGTYAFNTCKFELTAATIPEGVVTVGAYSFQSCAALKTISIPASCTTIGNYAFSGCLAVETITSKSLTAPTTSAQTFGNSATTYTGYTTRAAGTNVLHVPAGATGYTASYWKSPLCNASYGGFHIVEDTLLLAGRPFSYVEFNPNGGIGGGGMKKCFIGMQMGEIDIPIPEAPDGKVFAGWYTMRETGMRIEPSVVYDGEFQVVYAHWKDAE